jgi:hypothetical protein
MDPKYYNSFWENSTKKKIVIHHDIENGRAAKSRMDPRSANLIRKMLNPLSPESDDATSNEVAKKLLLERLAFIRNLVQKLALAETDLQAVVVGHYL